MYSVRVFGKWIMAGEHAVLRGHPALVFPAQACYFEIEYKESDEKLTAFCESEQGEQMKMVFFGLLDKALADVGRDRNTLHGHIFMKNTIPLVGGMGASAALCVTVTKLLNHWGWVENDEIFSFAKGLEDLFHGESSGVDIAIALKGKPLVYKMPGEFIEFTPNWQPGLYLSHCGKRGVTADCIRKVKKLWQTNEALAQMIDLDMRRSFELTQRALLGDTSRLDELQQGILLARSCFERWGLVGAELNQHMTELHKGGAIASKPTGSGEGGFVLSLWRNPPEALPFEMWRC